MGEYEGEREIAGTRLARGWKCLCKTKEKSCRKNHYLLLLEKLVISIGSKEKLDRLATTAYPRW
jgi:hypothetical protein